MSDRKPYTYVVLRYRHDPLTEEFMNVGVLLHSPRAAFLDAKMRHTAGRLPRMFPDLDVESLKLTLRRLEVAAKRLGQREGADLITNVEDALAIARRVLPVDDSSFVWSPMGSGISAEPAQTLEQLYSRFITLYDERGVARRDDAAVWRPIRDLLAERNLAHLLEPKTIRSTLDQVEFEHAWKNGAWHCIQPLSFDLSSEDTIREKAARWAGHMLALREPSEPFKPHFVVGAPANPVLADAYRSAVELLRISPGSPVVVEESEIEHFVDELEEEMKRHDHPFFNDPL